MSYGRIENHPILGQLRERQKINITFDGQLLQGYEEETIAAALLASGIRTLRYHEEKGTPRGIYCNIGHCFECRVTVNGKDGVRACITTISEGMEVRSGQVLPTPFHKKGGNEHD
ncbi:(2Fe-2S)-binding protein [Paenibacillus sp. N1-5-1-14]|uniref:(2Fe-2S)-binding protein n=1 Tax=Paenibacillus radicibacter TaxID=2972488 RepID=UPI0021597DE1|nr:(2Fe-2S)-binding protein [Paenibacillus radicibacter]MCR8644788.1 (2Fe-2S)-binding protein [Paenibacillus radicibacter]